MAAKLGTGPVVAIVGPTASGKTALAIELAQKVGGEIICADSRTVYRQMNVGTAKPTEAEQAAVKHHMLDVVDPDARFTVADFKARAEKCIQQVHSVGKVPIIVGGSGLYIDALLYNFQLGGDINDAHRNKLEQMTDEELTTLLVNKKLVTEGLNTKNRRHLIRALERNGLKPGKSALPANVLVCGVNIGMDILEQRIKNRVEQMFKHDFLEESRRLIEAYPGAEALQTPGYKAAARYFTGEIDIDQAKALFTVADRQLAKRQRTWFKRSSDIEWFMDGAELVARAVEFISEFNYNEAHV